jgi:hypothetical protein
MSKKRRWLTFGFGLLFLVFGLLCLNYTRADGLEHHRDVARRHHLPPPSEGILFGGVASVILGSATIGYAIGRRI